MRRVGMLLIVLGVLLGSNGAEEVPTGQSSSSALVRGILEGLASKDVKERLAAKKTLLRAHGELIDGLIVLAEQPKDRYGSADSRTLAIELLSDLGAQKAVPVFVKHVEFQPGGVGQGDFFLGGNPCAWGLARFMEDGTRGILAELGKIPPDQLSDKAIELYAHVFAAVYGRTDEGYREAIGVVERATARRTIDKENYQRLVDQLRAAAKGREQG